MYFVFSIYNSFSLILNKFNLVCIIDTVTMVLQSLNICAIYYYSNVMERDCLNMIDNVWNAYLRSFLFCVLLEVTYICIVYFNWILNHAFTCTFVGILWYCP